MQSSNPALISNPFSGFGRVTPSDAMTVGGTVNKTAVLLLLVLLPAAWVWNMGTGPNASSVQTWMLIGMIGGFIFSLVTIFKKEWAPVSAPLYSILQGLFLGGVSSIFEASYPGIVFRAVTLSVATLFTMLFLYRSGLIRPTERFKTGVIAATGGIALVYFISIILSFFNVNVPFINGGGLFGILFSVFVVGIAALNFILDFDFIAQASRGNVPKYMEWYGAFAMMVTLIWLYIEILRLLSKLSDRR